MVGPTARGVDGAGRREGGGGLELAYKGGQRDAAPRRCGRDHRLPRRVVEGGEWWAGLGAGVDAGGRRTAAAAAGGRELGEA